MSELTLSEAYKVIKELQKLCKERRATINKQKQYIACLESRIRSSKIRSKDIESFFGGFKK